MIICLLLTAGVLTLTIMYPRLDILLDTEAERVLDRQTFRSLHRMYLWVNTVEWGLGVAYLLLTPVAWRTADAERRPLQ